MANAQITRLKENNINWIWDYYELDGKPLRNLQSLAPNVS